MPDSMLGAEERTRMQDRQHSGEDRREATITECGQWEHIGVGGSMTSHGGSEERPAER